MFTEEHLCYKEYIQLLSNITEKSLHKNVAIHYVLVMLRFMK